MEFDDDDESSADKLKAGDIIELEEPFCANPKGAIGICISHESSSSPKIMFQNGCGAALSTYQKQCSFKVVTSDSVFATYQYDNDEDLHRDFDRGVFNPIFKKGDGWFSKKKKEMGMG